MALTLRNKYQISLWVTVEEELAIMQLFSSKGWHYINYNSYAVRQHINEGHLSCPIDMSDRSDGMTEIQGSETYITTPAVIDYPHQSVYTAVCKELYAVRQHINEGHLSSPIDMSDRGDGMTEIQGSETYIATPAVIDYPHQSVYTALKSATDVISVPLSGHDVHDVSQGHVGEDFVPAVAHEVVYRDSGEYIGTHDGALGSHVQDTSSTGATYTDNRGEEDNEQIHVYHGHGEHAEHTDNEVVTSASYNYGERDNLVFASSEVVTSTSYPVADSGLCVNEKRGSHAGSVYTQGIGNDVNEHLQASGEHDNEPSVYPKVITVYGHNLTHPSKLSNYAHNNDTTENSQSLIIRGRDENEHLRFGTSDVVSVNEQFVRDSNKSIDYDREKSNNDRSINLQLQRNHSETLRHEPTSVITASVHEQHNRNENQATNYGNSHVENSKLQGNNAASVAINYPSYIVTGLHNKGGQKTNRDNISDMNDGERTYRQLSRSNEETSSGAEVGVPENHTLQNTTTVNNHSVKGTQIASDGVGIATDTDILHTGDRLHTAGGLTESNTDNNIVNNQVFEVTGKVEEKTDTAAFQQKSRNCSLKQAAVTGFLLKSGNIEEHKEMEGCPISEMDHEDENESSCGTSGVHNTSEAGEKVNDQSQNVLAKADAVVEETIAGRTRKRKCAEKAKNNIKLFTGKKGEKETTIKKVQTDPEKFKKTQTKANNVKETQTKLEEVEKDPKVAESNKKEKPRKKKKEGVKSKKSQSELPILLEEDKKLTEMSLMLINYCDDDPFMCCLCNDQFKDVDHFVEHAKDKCLKDLVEQDDPPVFKCKDCGQHYWQAFTLVRHRLSQVCQPGKSKKTGGILACEICGKTYPTRRQTDFTLHVMMHHDYKPHACDQCGKKFMRWTSLRDHKRIHSGERPYKCNYCDLTFTTGSHQRNHELLKHIEVPRRFVCEKCGATFKFSGGLSTHMKEVHTEEKKFVCTMCGRQFKRRGSLTEHLKTHSDVRDKVCDVCGKTFYRRSHLNKHAQRHTNNRKHGCNDCGKRFFTKQSLMVHQRIHSGDKPYACKSCSYKCTSNGNLKKHILAVHPDVKMS